MSTELLKLKKFFFTQSNVKKMLDRKMYRTLSKFGAFTRTHAQRSMRNAKGPSKPGVPPHAHGRKLLRKLLYFSFDGKSSVVVGPILKPTTASIGIPRTMEKGGRIAKLHKDGLRVQNYPERPFMEPAGQTYLPKLAEWYAQS